jgi:hypothetical protein
VFARNGYPHLAVTANSNDAANLVKQMPTLFFFLNEPRHFGAALSEVRQAQGREQDQQQDRC